MRDIILGAATSLLVAVAMPAHATDAAGYADAASYGMDTVDYSNPYDDGAAKGLHFAALEAALPTDPLLWSADPGWQAHHTPAAMLADAHDALRAAVPRGTGADTARLTLERAGARCAGAGMALECRYRDVEMPRRGNYTDDVQWVVKIAMVGGVAGHIDVTRDWARH